MKLHIARISARRAVAAALAGLSWSAQAALVTLTGTHVDVTYDTERLGAYGTPTLAGDVLFFTTSGLSALSTDGRGDASSASLLDGIVVNVRAGHTLAGLEVSVFGDYRLSGTGSAVGVSGTLSAFDAGPPAGSPLTAALAVNADTPLGLADGLLHDWVATAVLGGAGPLLAPGVESFGLALSTLLSAGTDAAGSGPRVAFVEQKFSGLQLTFVSSTPMPAPPSLPLALTALAMAALAWRPTGLLRTDRSR